MSKTSKIKPKDKPSESPTRATLTEQLREMIRDSGQTVNAVAVASGVPWPVLQRFCAGERDNIRLDTADKLCAFFGVKLTAPRKRKPAMKGK